MLFYWISCHKRVGLRFADSGLRDAISYPLSPVPYPLLLVLMQRVMHVEGHEVVQAVGGFLVDEVQPVVVEEVGVAAPDEAGAFLGVVVGVVVFRQADGEAFFAVSFVFPFEGAQVVFEVAEDEDAAGFGVGDDVDAVVAGAGEDGEFRCFIDFHVVDGCVAGLGDEVAVVEAAKEWVVVHGEAVLVDAEEFAGKDFFLYAVAAVESGLGGPAEVQGGEYVGVCPFEVFQHFGPVFDFFVCHFFYRCAGDDEAVVAAVFDVLEGEVVFFQV